MVTEGKMNSLLNCTGNAHIHIHRLGFCCERHFELINHAGQFNRLYGGLVLIKNEHQ